MLPNLAIAVWTSVVLSCSSTSLDFDSPTVAAEAAPSAAPSVFRFSGTAFANALFMEPSPHQFRRPSPFRNLALRNSRSPQVGAHGTATLVRITIFTGVVLLAVGGWLVSRLEPGAPGSQPRRA